MNKPSYVLPLTKQINFEDLSTAFTQYTEAIFQSGEDDCGVKEAIPGEGITHLAFRPTTQLNEFVQREKLSYQEAQFTYIVRAQTVDAIIPGSDQCADVGPCTLTLSRLNARSTVQVDCDSTRFTVKLADLKRYNISVANDGTQQVNYLSSVQYDLTSEGVNQEDQKDRVQQTLRVQLKPHLEASTMRRAFIKFPNRAVLNFDDCNGDPDTFPERPVPGDIPLPCRDFDQKDRVLKRSFEDTNSEVLKRAEKQ